MVMLDPPTFSRDNQGNVFTIESGFPALVQAAEAVLAAPGALFCSTNQRTLTPEAFRRLIGQGLSQPRAWVFKEPPMPPDFTGERYLKACWLGAGRAPVAGCRAWRISGGWE